VQWLERRRTTPWGKKGSRFLREGEKRRATPSLCRSGTARIGGLGWKRGGRDRLGQPKKRGEGNGLGRDEPREEGLGFSSSVFIQTF
jgi:hypothetical protein